MSKLIKNITAFMKDEEGLTVVEYVVGAGLLVLAMTAIFDGLVTDLRAELAGLF
ncbi:Flp family type IVb pilin [Vibrio europaeus]|uniref:Flp family type IVb pilin n=1 Tax=Vibrio europaeus TaxID=300876 RepID=A0AAE7ASX6_9VIBR|nr:Flp family type IVb pilin [Vibrio europaeus]MDC5803925.1 Flp family type IVb pilin [Vibrio europaeus]MDC5810177.1 Flp family type IVb pilin [Vibrio europaeus]MDC5823798.1 Flp family type IVb pilin [Vibrio europaeus]MDC5828366.1 Flp family type IVb pilin [Vibrio europaeus]MDC5833530.1 Flp family type IVb pilin [Vibrio europaeus]